MRLWRHENGKQKCFTDCGDCQHFHIDKYRVHINIERCATHSIFASEPNLCAYIRQGWIQPLYQQWELEAHQGIVGGDTRQIMLLIVQDTCEGVWKSTKCN